MRRRSRPLTARAVAVALLATMSVELAALTTFAQSAPPAKPSGSAAPPPGAAAPSQGAAAPPQGAAPPQSAAPAQGAAPAEQPEGTAPAQASDAAAGEKPEPSEAVKQEARNHFLKGLALLREEAWGAALAEFTLSRELYPTRAATNNAAIALRKLQRYDEALDMFETLLRDFPTLPAPEKSAAQRAVVELRGLVGTIELTDSEPGATIAVSGQTRGDYPPVTPLRVSAGTHIVRVFKEGFEPFETRVDVAGGLTVNVEARLRKLTSAGRLKVNEQGGRTLEVVVDNVVVGTTPWEGSVAVGEHTVSLRGKDKLGTQPVSAPVKPQEITALSLRAEELDSAMRVEPTPAGARVAINSVTVGRGAWAGRLKTGTHRVEVAADGFQTATRQVVLERGEREIVTVQLQRDPDAAFWQKPPKIMFELDGSMAFVPSFGGDVADGCRGSCARSLGIGAVAQVHAGYELGSGIGFGITAGYLSVTQGTEGREATIVPNNLGPQPGTANDDLLLRSFLVGGTVGLHVGERFPALFRLGVGALLGSIRDERTGSFTARDKTTYDAYPITDAAAARYMYITPEVRAGVRIGKNFELSAGMKALLLIAPSPPRWDDTIELAAGSDGVGTYPADALTGGFVVVLAPGLAARYDF